MKQIQIPVPESFRSRPMFSAGERVVRRLQSAGYFAAFVGGAPRDLLLGRFPKDIDIATSARPEEITALFEHTLAIGASFCVMTVLEDGCSFEVATLREEREYCDGRHPETIHCTTDPELDVIRRDFTINAMLYDPVSGDLIDYTGGMDDLRKRILRAVGDPNRRFAEDHLRMLRAVRFAVRYGCELDPASRDAICRDAASITRISAERIREELEKMLLGPRPDKAVRMLSELGLLQHILPEVEALHGVEQPPRFHPEGDVFEHTMMMLEHFAWQEPRIVWSALLHDIGKPSTQTFTEEGVPHFYGHETAGAGMAEAVMKRLHASNSLIEAVTNAVRNHMRFAHIDKMKPSKWKRIMADENFTMELELHRLDCRCSNFLMGNYLLMLDRMHEMELANEKPVPKPLLSGVDLIRAGLKPGPLFGAILEEAADLQLEGALHTREEALDWLRKKAASL